MEKVHLIIDYQKIEDDDDTGRKRTNKANKASKTSGKKYDNLKNLKKVRRWVNFLIK